MRADRLTLRSQVKPHYMIKIYSLLMVVIALLLYGIYKQYQVAELKAEILQLKHTNSEYKKKMANIQDKFSALKGQLGYLNVEAASLRSDIIFIKANPGQWSIPETENGLEELETGITEAQNESE